MQKERTLVVSTASNRSLDEVSKGKFRSDRVDYDAHTVLCCDAAYNCDAGPLERFGPRFWESTAMNTARDAVSGSLVGYASKLRFPRLLLLTAGIFVVDLIVPDLLPFVDEVLLGLTTLILASLRTRVKETISPASAPATPGIEQRPAGDG